MAVFNAAFPVLPGKEDQARAFAAEIGGARRAEFGDAQASIGITRETWTLQETPEGWLVLIWIEAADVEKAFEGFATATDDVSVWQRAQILEVSGMDMSEPDDDPPPEVILDWS